MRSDSTFDALCFVLTYLPLSPTSRLTLLYNPNNVASAPTLPTGWSAGSCMTEVTNARALPNASTSGKTMTVET